MPGSNAQEQGGANHATYERTNATYVSKTQAENPSVPDPRKPVDNRNPVFYLVGGHLVFGVPKAVA